MNYSESTNNKTFLEELPSIDSIKQRYIRNDSMPVPESGMMSSNDVSYDSPYSTYGQQYGQQQQMPQMMTPISEPKHDLSCREVAAHVMSCDICRSFYNLNVTPYIVTIIALILIVLFLVKNILNLK